MNALAMTILLGVLVMLIVTALVIPINIDIF